MAGRRLVCSTGGTLYIYCRAVELLLVVRYDEILDGFFGFLSPTLGAHFQILPGITEAAGYDLEAIHPLFTLIVLLGSWAEVILPLLILVGLFTRGAALAMMGFVVVQSVVDIWGHDVAAGAWFDRASDSVIMDQRLFWLFILAILVTKGAGPLSIDRALSIDS